MFKNADTISQEQGEKSILAAEVGAVILAGGRGSRLGSTPKALFPVLGKALVDHFYDKKRTNCPLALMVSTANKEVISAFIKEKKIELFCQQMKEALLKQTGEVARTAEGSILLAPAGNGSFFRSFKESGLLDEWKKKGIKYITIVPIDNPLADPFNLKLLSAHIESEAEVSLIAVKREPGMGSIVISKDRTVKIIEYTDMHDPHADLGNTGLFCFNLDFIERVAKMEFPWHKVEKMGPCGVVWLFETFIFDVLEYSQKTQVLLFDAEETFAPLKEKEGKRSVEYVEKALLKKELRDRKRE